MSIAVHIGQTKNGRVLTTLDGDDLTSLSWIDELNGNGSITVTVPEAVGVTSNE